MPPLVESNLSSYIEKEVSGEQLNQQFVDKYITSLEKIVNEAKTDPEANKVVVRCFCIRNLHDSDKYGIILPPEPEYEYVVTDNPSRHEEDNFVYLHNNLITDLHRIKEYDDSYKAIVETALEDTDSSGGFLIIEKNNNGGYDTNLFLPYDVELSEDELEDTAKKLEDYNLTYVTNV